MLHSWKYILVWGFANTLGAALSSSPALVRSQRCLSETTPAQRRLPRVTAISATITKSSSDRCITHDPVFGSCDCVG